jgi:hypothetical protein
MEIVKEWFVGFLLLVGCTCLCYAFWGAVLGMFGVRIRLVKKGGK